MIMDVSVYVCLSTCHLSVISLCLSSTLWLSILDLIIYLSCISVSLTCYHGSTYLCMEDHGFVPISPSPMENQRVRSNFLPFNSFSDSGKLGHHYPYSLTSLTVNNQSPIATSAPCAQSPHPTKATHCMSHRGLPSQSATGWRA